MPEEEIFPLTLHPDGTDTLYCKECETKFYDGEDDAKLGGPCPSCIIEVGS